MQYCDEELYKQVILSFLFLYGCVCVYQILGQKWKEQESLLAAEKANLLHQGINVNVTHATLITFST